MIKCPCGEWIFVWPDAVLEFENMQVLIYTCPYCGYSHEPLDSPDPSSPGMFDDEKCAPEYISEHPDFPRWE